MENKILSEAEVDKLFSSVKGDFQRDNSGQVVIYTDVWEWVDGTFRTYPDPNLE